jgi:hypothetical protein
MNLNNILNYFSLISLKKKNFELQILLIAQFSTSGTKEAKRAQSLEAIQSNREQVNRLL